MWKATPATRVERNQLLGRLSRLTGTKHPDGTTTTNLYTIGSAYPNSSGGLTILDVTATKTVSGIGLTLAMTLSGERSR